MSPPEIPRPPRLFLVDGYALIYRAFFALLTRPLITGRGENTSAVWGIANFINRLHTKHTPEYLGWVHDAGLSFRHERYPPYKATREKLSDELQADFDQGMVRIEQLLAANRIPILSLDGYEADDVIGTMARQGAAAGLNVVIVSGDKDFQQLVQPHIWLLNPGRGGPASVDEHWVGVENGSERLGVPPGRVTDYLALVGDSSDNVPGVKGIGEKTAQELIGQFPDLEAILAGAASISKKRPREALLEHAELARLSKELVTIRDDLPLTLDLDALRVRRPDIAKLGELYVTLEFHAMAKALPAESAGAPSAVENDSANSVDAAAPERVTVAATDAAGWTAAPSSAVVTDYKTVDTITGVAALVRRVRDVGRMAVDTETVSDPGAPIAVDPMRARLVSISIAIEPGEAYYLPFAHRAPIADQGELLPTADDAVRAAAAGIRNLPAITGDAMKDLRALLEDPAIGKTGQNAKYDLLVLRRAGVTMRGIEFDTMLASYVLDPGRRSHGLDMLALQFLGHTMISYEDVCGKGKKQITFDQVAIAIQNEFRLVSVVS